MTKLAMLGSGCIREQAMELHFIEMLENQNIQRSTSLEDSDYILYITCAGVGDTIKKCLKEIQHLVDYQHYKNPNLKLIIVGCLTEFYHLFEEIDQLENIKIIKNKDWIIPTFNYLKNENKKNTTQTRLENRTRFYYGSHISAQFFLESGCINHCSFCKNNYFSRKVESTPYDSTLNYLKGLIHSGTKSLCLSGENVTLYGIDLEKKPLLHRLLQDLSKEEELVNIAVHEVTAQNMYPQLEEELIYNPKIKRVSIQLESGSEKILNMMNRHYTLEKYDKLVAKLINNHKFVTTILMSGFPTETYDDLDKTIEYVRGRQIFTDSVCQYVDFEHLPSSWLEQLTNSEKREHTLYLQKAVLKNNYKVLKNYIPYMNEVIIAGRSNGYTIMEGASNVYAVSRQKKYQEMELGTIIHTPPKKLVKRSSFNHDIAYKY